MLDFASWAAGTLAGVPVGQTGVDRSPLDVFQDIYWVFLILGTLVGVVVIAYTLWNAWIYRDDGEREEETGKKVVRPTMGELPVGSGGGKKLFVSFGISAVIVLSLVVYAYVALLYVEQTPEDNREEALEVDVVGQQFSWQFEYPNGESTGTLYAPTDRMVVLNVTSADVFHNLGIPGLGLKSDAIPGHTTETWFVAEETGEYEAICYELCGAGHTNMRSSVEIMDQESFQEWYDGDGDTETQSVNDAPAQEGYDD